ncbi:MAG: ribonuclease R [Peptococcaceae bacterium]|jgi:ribonuclease R|nr:ribonuclease R [Peptococcaceae bacterium]MDH7524738.1 ribonuclease R [Peptococcaceae bacterium]
MKTVAPEEILEHMMRHSYRPMTAGELGEVLEIEDVSRLVPVLAEMEKQGDIVKNRRGRYGLPQKMNLRVGRIQGNRKGFAFLVPDDPGEQDVFILSEDLNGAMHNDRVVVRLYRHLANGRKSEGKVIRILKRANERVVGTYERNGSLGFVVPDDRRLGHDIFVTREDAGSARDNDKVVVEITRWPGPRRSPEGRIIEILGQKGDPVADVLSIIRKYQLPEVFPAEVLKEAEKIPLVIGNKEHAGRRDLRGLAMVTIDGEDAKDLDDAVSLERLPGGNYRLGVHIADVGYYVREGSLLDQEALKRGTSVYLVDRVIPMLPPRLSNGICSLNANEDRLAMTCFMEINETGGVVGYEICRSVIRVRERMTYTAVRKILEERDAGLLKRYGEYIEMFELMKDLCLILREKRLRRGAVDFDFPEAVVTLDGAGRPLGIAKRERSIAEMIIEEFMIAANETVAGHCCRLGIPFLYRVHEKPDLDDLRELNEFLGAFGYRIKTSGRGEVTPGDFQRIVEKAKGRPEEKAVTMTMLRSMKHARYAPEAIGHFGLAARYYTHFTSPIRRYPDLAIHRIICEAVEAGSLPAARTRQLERLMAGYAQQSSLREKIAEDAERESVDLKKAEFMKGLTGEVFSGFISGVKSFGFFVELDSTVEGLVHVSTLDDDYYQYDDRRLVLVGEHTGKSYRIGDAVKVRVSGVSIEERRVDFELAPDEEKKAGRLKARKKRLRKKDGKKRVP